MGASLLALAKSIYYVLIWKWNGFNFASEQSAWLFPSILRDNLTEEQSPPSPQKDEGRRSVCGGAGDCTQASLRWIIHF